ncbi:MAG: ribosome biogenesis GTPase Der [Planctomycetota bacterium]
MQNLKIIPNIVIVGRPNVGKSTLFNALLKRRAAIVDSIPGTTRDRLSAQVTYETFSKNPLNTHLINGGKEELLKFTVELTDTGGIEFDSKQQLFWSAIQKQIDTALNEANILLFVVDVRNGVTSVDEKISKMLHNQNKPVILCVNKADTWKLEDGQNEFYKLGWPLIVISALQKRGLDTLREVISEKLSEENRKSPPEPDRSDGLASGQAEMTIAIVGKRNVGKSTLVNTLARQERTIVSEIPGTTRDSIDVKFERQSETFIAIDTAGILRRRKLKEAVDIYSQQRTESSIRRADVVIFLIDAQERISEMDKKIADSIIENKKPCVIIINKWDLVKDKMSTEDYRKYLDKAMPFMGFAPIVFSSAKTGFNVNETIELTTQLYKQAGIKIQTSILNKVTEKIKANIPVVKRGAKQPKIYYAIQSGSYPPTFTLMINNSSLFSKRAIRYIEQQLHKELPIQEVPIRIVIRSKPRSKITTGLNG